jgi:N6-adenosine-specific RNA methylase IME4
MRGRRAAEEIAMTRNTMAELHALVDSGYRAGVISGDPPHRYETYSDKGRDRCADRHYAVMEHEDILAMGPLVKALAAKDCALSLWTSGTFAERSYEIAEAWGFRFITFAFVWIKTKKNCLIIEPDELTEADLPTGLGKTTRAGAEFVLLAKRGSPPRLDKKVDQVVIAPRGRHSEKPEEVARRIERLYPGPYLELFARRQRPGWTCWGNEVPPLSSNSARIDYAEDPDRRAQATKGRAFYA